MPVRRTFTKAASASGTLRLAVALAGTAVVTIAAAASPAAAAPSQRADRAAAQALTPPGLFGWGGDNYGDLGNGATGLVTTPVSVALPAGLRQVSAGLDFSSAAVLSDGRVATWGHNNWGQLGDGTTTDRRSPAVVPGLTGIIQVVAGEHMLALDSAGTVWSWGDNFYGQLGNGTASTIRGSNPAPVPVPGLSGVVQIAAGTSSSYALRADGTVWAWGANEAGELGDGTDIERHQPVQIPGLSGVTKVAAGEATAYAIRAGGSVLAWGENTDGLLGDGTTGGFSARPVAVPGLAGVTQLSSGGAYTLAVAGSAGAVWAWGVNADGRFGDGATTNHYTPEQTGLTGVISITAGGSVSAAALSNGSVLTWGENGYGQLGIGNQDSNLHPAPVLVKSLAGASQVSAAQDHVLAIASQAPRVPSVIGYSQSDAAQVLQAAGYVLGRVAIVVDLTCEYLGEVKTQTPPAGTIDPPGTAVNVTIGKAGGKCL